MVEESDRLAGKDCAERRGTLSPCVTGGPLMTVILLYVVLKATEAIPLAKFSLRAETLPSTVRTSTY